MVASGRCLMRPRWLCYGTWKSRFSDLTIQQREERKRLRSEKGTKWDRIGERRKGEESKEENQIKIPKEKPKLLLKNKMIKLLVFEMKLLQDIEILE